MDNSDFYVAAATVIPLLLIALIATRSFRPGQMRKHPIIAVLMFGLPVIGEIAAFSFLFFAPVPTAAAALLAVATWAGLLSQLALAAWWVAELLRRDIPPEPGSNEHAVESPAEVRPSTPKRRSSGTRPKAASAATPGGYVPGLSPVEPLWRCMHPGCNYTLTGDFDNPPTCRSHRNSPMARETPHRPDDTRT
jgi:hypothetical protein